MPNIIDRIVADGLCAGCGLCAAHAGTSRVRMEMNDEGYLRPQISSGLNKRESSEIKRICPGISLDLKKTDVPTHRIWGPIVTCATGWATDEEIRFRGSSGGAITALLLALLDTGSADFIAHIAADPSHPLRNTMRISRTRDEVLSGAGSRYAPSAPLAALDDILAQPGRFAFVGKPCDAAALRGYLAERPALAERVVAIISFMCAGIPSEKGSEKVIRAMGGNPRDVATFSYRGNGWPGMATATLRDGRRLEMDYATSWGTILNRHLQFRCKICPDGTGEFADIVCADAWHGKDGYPDFGEQTGRSLILARTTTGERLLQMAVQGGFLVRQPGAVQHIAGMQPYQLTRKQLLASRLLAIVLGRRSQYPRFQGLRLLSAAFGIGPVAHLRNLIGTYRRLPAPPLAVTKQ